MTSTLNGVVVDLSRHPEVDYAVILEGQLLPTRFGSLDDASRHLFGLRTGTVLVNPKIAQNVEAGHSLRDGEAA